MTNWLIGVLFPLMLEPRMNTSEKSPFQAQVPVFNSSQVFLKRFPGIRVVPSGMVMSETKMEASQISIFADEVIGVG